VSSKNGVSCFYGFFFIMVLDIAGHYYLTKLLAMELRKASGEVLSLEQRQYKRAIYPNGEKYSLYTHCSFTLCLVS